jgi:hypothetical protein
MKSAFGIAAVAALMLGGVGMASAHHQSVSPSASGSAASEDRGEASAGAAVTTSAEADARADVEKHLRAIKRRAMAIKSSAVRKTERQLEAIAQRVDQAASPGEQPVAERLATEFAITPEAMAGEKTQCECRWGDLTIAHTLAANSKDGVTAEQLIELRRGGLVWSQIAAGMGYPSDRMVDAVHAESKVALGSTNADGKVAMIHARSGDVARGHAGSKTSMRNGVTNTGLETSAGTSVKVGSSMPVPVNKP